MIWVLLGGWLLLAVCAAALFHIARSRFRPVTIPPEVQQFLRRLEREIRDEHPRFEIRGMVPGRFTLLVALRGQEIPVGLHHLYRRCVAFPDGFSEAVSRFLDEVERGGMDAVDDFGFADVAPDILPQLRSQVWLREKSPAMGDAVIAHRQFADDLVICYVIDDTWSMTFVTRAHLRFWGRTEEDLYNLATRNLHRMAGGDVPLPEPDGTPTLLRTGDGYDAARVLLLDPEQVDGLLVAVPDRDVLWLGQEGDDSIGELMAMSREQSDGAAHPVSPHLYRVQGGGLVQITEDAEPV